MAENERPNEAPDRLAESVRRALRLVGPTDSGTERASDDRPGDPQT